MKPRYTRTSLLLFAFVIALTVAPAPAQRRTSPDAVGAQYDPKTELTLKGTVEEIATDTMPNAAHGRGPGAGMMMGGTHVKLAGTTKGVMDVRLGPSSYLADKKFTILKGDTLEVTGSLLKVDGNDVVVAREIKKGKDKLELRDKNGMPLWSGYKSPAP